LPVGVAVEKGLNSRAVRGRPRRSLGGQRGGERQVAPGEVGEAQEVGRHALPLAGEHRAGAPEADGDLVADEQHTVAIAQLAHRAQVAGRVGEHPGRALHERLDDHRRHSSSCSASGPCRLCRRPAVGVEQKRPEASGRAPCRRPTPSRSCRRGRRPRGRRTRSSARAARPGAASTGTPSSARPPRRSSRSPSRRPGSARGAQSRPADPRAPRRWGGRDRASWCGRPARAGRRRPVDDRVADGRALHHSDETPSR
jgi:hypothetical protein